MAISVSRIYTNMQGFVQKYNTKIFDAIPTTEVKGKTSTFINWAGKELSSAENRLILGVTALASQPFIDLNNKKVNEKTRIVSCAKTLAKIIAGTLTGVLIRKGCILAVKKLSKIPQYVNGTSNIKHRLELFFTPKGANINDLDKYAQYQNAMGTVLGIVVMLYTNFAIDLPLTKFLTNYFNDKFQKKGGTK